MTKIIILKIVDGVFYGRGKFGVINFVLGEWVLKNERFASRPNHWLLPALHYVAPIKKIALCTFCIRGLRISLDRFRVGFLDRSLHNSHLHIQRVTIFEILDAPVHTLQRASASLQLLNKIDLFTAARSLG